MGAKKNILWTEQTEHLELNFNNLEEIYGEFNFLNLEDKSDGMFDGLNPIDELRISIANNKLTTIPYAQFCKLPRPMTLDISGNPLKCDSDLCWLRQEVETGTIKWLQETEENQTFPVGHVFKPTCADGTIWDDITWNCGEGKIKITFVENVSFFKILIIFVCLSNVIIN